MSRARVRRWLLRTVLAAGLAFLYAPIVSVVLFSFNAASSVAVWGGFSLQWYEELLGNDNILRAARLSLTIAAMSATGATILGTLAGFALTRLGWFRGRTLLATMAISPLVMPEIIIGVSMLLLFVGLEGLIGWPRGRGVLTITLAHITYTAAFAAIVVQGRLAGLDRSIEEAALDLGARPPVVFFLITVPMIAPAMVAGWLLGFSISLDDVIVTQFTSGPGSTTLPLLIFSLVRHGVKPDINAVATVFVAVAILVTFGITGLQRWRAGRRAEG
ncbi:MAG: ABC transporter permease subunit [Dongiaceae bacterium]